MVFLVYVRYTRRGTAVPLHLALSVTDVNPLMFGQAKFTILSIAKYNI